MFWAAARLQPQRERLALHCLTTERGFTTYAPRISDQRLVRGRTIETHPLLFAGYAFVLIVAHWYDAAYAPGVIGLVGGNGGPSHVPDGVIAALRRREGPDGLVVLPTKRKANGFRRGERLHIVRGALQGLDGLYQGQAPHERVRVLLSLLGAPRVIELAADDVRRIGRRR
jgi:transcription antitermination factor NusG